MANRIVVYWRDIPAQVIIKKGRATAKRELSLRFTEAIDMCAMRTGAAETDDYLAEWRRADPVEVSDDLEAEADTAAAATPEASPSDYGRCVTRGRLNGSTPILPIFFSSCIRSGRPSAMNAPRGRSSSSRSTPRAFCSIAACADNARCPQPACPVR